MSAAPDISPWPWELEQKENSLGGKYLDVIESGGAVLATLWCSEEDGKLMAAAPEIADAAETLLDTLKAVGIISNEVFECAAELEFVLNKAGWL